MADERTDEDWRTRECLNQISLWFALKVRCTTVVGVMRPADAIRTPLPPFGNRLAGDLEKRLERVGQSPADREKVVTSTLGSISHQLIAQLKDKLATTPPWSIGDVVGWWIAAGVAMNEWWASLARADAPAPAGPHQEVMRYEEWLWHTLVRHLQIDDDEEYPAIWLAQHVASWKVRVSQLEHCRPEAWDAAATTPDDCRLAMLEWCGAPDRELVDAPKPSDSAQVDAWAADYELRYHDQARAALRLLRRRFHCVRRTPLVSDAADGWRIAQTARSPTARHILRPPMAAINGGKHEVPGWLVSPWPAVVLEQCRRITASLKTQPGSIGRSIAEAAATLRPEDRSFAPLPPWSLGEQAGDGIDRLAAGVERLAAVARLATVAELMPSIGSAEEQAATASAGWTSQLSAALALEGFQVCRIAADSGATRRIPLAAAGGATEEKPAARLQLARTGSETAIDVGFVGPSAACPDELVAAIEQLDWRWWATAAARGECDPTGVADRLAQFAVETGWEPLKCRLLDLAPESPDAPQVLAEAYTTLESRMCIGLNAAAEGVAAARLRSLLAGGISGVAAAVLKWLLSLDPVGQGGLYPPRTSAGRVDLAACAGDSRRNHPRARDWLFTWQRSNEQFGVQAGTPQPHEGRFRVAFSAGATATDEDLRALDDMAIASSRGSPWDVIWLPLRTRVASCLEGAKSPDFTAAMAELRQRLEGPDARAFHDLVTLAVNGEARALTTLRILSSDSRFAFACHPKIDVGELKAALRPPAIGDAIVWRDDPDVPADQDIEVVYALNPAGARRTVSRGQPAAASREACAARFEEATPSGSPARVAAENLRKAIDQQRMFSQGDDPRAAVIAAADAVVRCGPDDAWATAAYAELANCCRACGWRFVPEEWSVTDGAAADGLAVSRHGFHATVPAGRAVVERCGIAGADGGFLEEPVWFKSAGPEPDGYKEVVEKMSQLTGETDTVVKFQQHVQDLPRRVVNGEEKTAIPALFKVAWEAKEMAPDRSDIEAAVQAVHRLLERSYDMLLFSPQSTSEVAETWLETRSGGKPRGNRVHVLRPGVRTRDNKLVRPAIVETE